MTHHDHKQGGCCGGDKHHEHNPIKKEPEKEKNGCCGGEKDNKSKPDQEKTVTQGGCCGGSKK